MPKDILTEGKYRGGVQTCGEDAGMVMIGGDDTAQDVLAQAYKVRELCSKRYPGNCGEGCAVLALIEFLESRGVKG